MTTRSRSPRSSPRPFRYDRLVAAVIATWHAGCIVLGQMACFVTWEMPLVEENEPPTIFPGGYEDGELVTMDEDTTFFVRAQDPDSQEPLLFLWEAGNDALFGEPSQIGEPGEEAGALWYSLVVVEYDPDLDGDTVQCHVYDADGANVDLSWPLEVL